MKSAILQVLLAGALGLSVTTMQAQDNQADRKTEAGGTVNVTGCLQKGASANAYSITGEDGKSYNLSSTSVKLEDHLNHKVTVTGKTSTDTAAKGHSESTSTSSSPSLTVSSLKMVSASCQ